MKRFTETLKWSDPWFRKLKPESKLLWFWILDNCDAAGVIDPDLELASFQIGYQYPLDTLCEFGDRVSKLPCGKYHVVKFIAFQHGEKLSRSCKAHNPVFQSLSQHGIELDAIGYAKGMGKGMDTPQAKVKVKATVKAIEGAGRFEPQDGVEASEPFSIPAALKNPKFIEAWHRWLAHLGQKNRTPTILAGEMQMAKLEEMGSERAIAALNNSIAANYQSIVEPMPAKGAPQTKPVLDPRRPCGGNF